ncbi:MAG: polyprenyl synthetase family protein [Oscillospiraceae bacterium]|jgi:geranylgeranyl diphosphate synthase type II|nr:polyprenyl synthetase family protein [Oscillospiraceae bacterium]
MPDYTARLAADVDAVNAAIACALPQKASMVGEAMRYSIANGGKRIRPVLVMECCALCGGAPMESLPFAAAIEMIHTYSLIHDDLPCMDNDDYRRGQLACHRKYGEAIALLAGDALLTHTFLVAAQAAKLSVNARLRGTEVLAQAAGAQGMIGGQMQDLQLENISATREQLEEMNRKKTGELLRAACLLGCIAADAPPAQIAAIENYAGSLGLLFQVTDDILDVTGDAKTLGKPIGSDKTNQKSTWVTLLGLTKARAYCGDLENKAIAALESFGASAGFLRWLTNTIANRSY